MPHSLLLYSTVRYRTSSSNMPTVQYSTVLVRVQYVYRRGVHRGVSPWLNEV